MRRLLQSQSSPLIEALEDRRLLSATVINPGGPPINLGLVPMPTVSNVVAPVHGERLNLKVGEAFHGHLGHLAGISGGDLKFFAVGASIDWGDGTSPTAGTLSIGKTGTVGVSGTHTYANTGRFAIEITARPAVVAADQANLQPSIVFGIIDGLAIVTPVHTNISLDGVVTGKYSPGIGANYNFTGTGKAGVLGHVTAVGSVFVPGAGVDGRATGTLTLTTETKPKGKSGSVTLSLTGPSQTGIGAGLRSRLQFVITAGTGAYADAAGSGTIAVKLGERGIADAFSFVFTSIRG